MYPCRLVRCKELKDQRPQHIIQLLCRLIGEREEEVDDSSLETLVKSEVFNDCRGKHCLATSGNPA